VIDLERAKASHDCRTWIAAELGESDEQRQEYSKWFCPFHADRKGNTPSLTVWFDHYHCYGCGAHGDIIDWVRVRQNLELREAVGWLLNEQPTLSAQLHAAEVRHRERAKEERRLAQEHLAKARWHDQYADALVSHRLAVDYLEARGIPEAVAMYYRLGFRAHSPWGACISIPWMVSGELRGIQYRIINGQGDMRYRWDERAHGKPTIYNADAVKGSKPLWIVEGAFKALVLITRGLESVALVSKQGWKSGWAGRFRHQPVFVCLDPDAIEEGRAIAADIGPNSKVVELPRKPDDLMVEWGWTAQAMEAFAREGVAG
jgi:hypothetical protein